MIPQIAALDNNGNTTTISTIEVQSQPSKTFKDNNKLIAGTIDGIEAITQTIEHILVTERYAYPIYPDWYGMELEKYKGQSFEYLQAQIEKDLTEALTQDNRILSIEVTDIIKESIDSASVIFNVYSTEGVIEGMEANFNV